MDLSFILDNMQHKLESWKAKKLSIVGKVILAKYVLEAIPTYYMKVANPP